MASEVVVSKEVKDVSTQVSRLVKEANILTIADAEDANTASLLLNTAKDMKAAIDERRKKITRPMDEAKREVMELFREPIERVESLITDLSTRLIDFSNAQKAAQRKAEAEARAKAEEESKRLLKEAEALQAKGLVGVARSLELAAKSMPTAAANALPKVAAISGQTEVERWSYEVEDLAKVPREYLMLDEVKVAAVVRAMKAETNIAGIKVIKGMSLSRLRGA